MDYRWHPLFGGDKQESVPIGILDLLYKRPNSIYC